MFVKEYLIDLNATQAAIRAGYSEKTANVIGAENLAKPYIADAIKSAMENRANKVDIDAEWVLREAKDTYKAAREAEELGHAVAALKLVGAHVDVQAFKERTELSGPDGGPIQTIQRTIIDHA